MPTRDAIDHDLLVIIRARHAVVAAEAAIREILDQLAHDLEAGRQTTQTRRADDNLAAAIRELGYGRPDALNAVGCLADELFTAQEFLDQFEDDGDEPRAGLDPNDAFDMARAAREAV